MKYSLFVFLFLISSCKTNYAVLEVNESLQKFDDNYIASDTLIAYEIAPYRLALNESMNGVIAQVAEDLIKAKPESTLGNLLADATKNIAQELTTKQVDIAIINYGGIRVPSMNKGPVSLGNVFEIMPFDNYLVLQELDGYTLQTLSDIIAASGGWPISGYSFTIKDKKAINIEVNGTPLVLNKKYIIAISDYLADGGDNLSMLKSFEQENTNMLLRDAFIQYFKQQQKLGVLLNAKLENRISYE